MNIIETVLEDFVVEPVKKLISAAKSIPELLSLAEKAAADYSTGGIAGIAEDVLDNFEGGIVTVTDAALTAYLTSLGPIGVALDAPAIAAFNGGAAALKAKAHGLIEQMFDHAGSKVTAAPAAAPAPAQS
jgi:hypothetical protein